MERVASANFNQMQLPPLSFVNIHGHGKCSVLSACHMHRATWR